MRRRIRPIVPLVVFLAVVAAPASARAAPCWAPPVEAPVTDPFRAPACPWCPGNRGIEYGTPPGAAVRAVAAGTVTFAGDVAGTRYVVVELAGGWRVTYGNLADREVGRGDRVVAGQRLGTTAGRFHFGLRDRAAAGDPPGDDAYLDPTPYLGEWRYRVRLIPVDGVPRPSPPPTLVCGAESVVRDVLSALTADSIERRLTAR